MVPAAIEVLDVKLGRGAGGVEVVDDDRDALVVRTDCKHAAPRSGAGRHRRRPARIAAGGQEPDHPLRVHVVDARVAGADRRGHERSRHTGATGGRRSARLARRHDLAVDAHQADGIGAGGLGADQHSKSPGHRHGRGGRASLRRWRAGGLRCWRRGGVAGHVVGASAARRHDAGDGEDQSCALQRLPGCCDAGLRSHQQGQRHCARRVTFPVLSSL